MSVKAYFYNEEEIQPYLSGKSNGNEYQFKVAADEKHTIVVKNNSNNIILHYLKIFDND